MGLFSSGKKRILIADDDAAARFLLREALSGEFEISEASDGEETVKQASGSVPDLIILDQGMPGMAGIDVVKVLRSREKTKAVPILMCTGFSLLDMVDDLLDAGANDYLTKPVDLAKLRLKIRKVLASA